MGREEREKEAREKLSNIGFEECPECGAKDPIGAEECALYDETLIE